MEKMHLEMFINAPREKVWNTMLEKATYEEWTKPFNPTSTYEGEWKEGAKMLFVGESQQPGTEGQLGGMVSKIEVVRPYEFVSILHQGMVMNGVEDTTSDMIKDWAGAHENYTFNEKDGGTELVVDMDIMASEKQQMEDSWKVALEKLKEIVQR